MDHPTHYIKSYCAIYGRTIEVGGKTIFQSEAETDLMDFLKAAYRFLEIDYPKFHKMDGLCKAIFIAAELMARESGPFDSNTSLIFSNRSSSYISDSRHAQGILGMEDAAVSPATFVYTLPNIAMGEISIRHKLHSENVFFIFDRYLPEFLVPYTNSMLDKQRNGNALSGWAEINEQHGDLLLYHIGTSGDGLHTVDQLKSLYNKQNE